MSHVLVRLRVQDYAKWKPVFDRFGTMRKEYGSKGGLLFRKVESPNAIVVLFEWADLDQARRYFQSEELRKGMQEAGVSGGPDVNYLGEAEMLAA